jgi:hypothetical protein
LSRHPIDTIQTAAFIEGSRDDVILEGKDQLKTFSINPHKVLGQRLHKSDSKFYNRDINHIILEDYDPINIYEMKVLPADERSIHKFNEATFVGIDKANTNSMEACTVYTLPYWMGVYHKMLKL